MATVTITLNINNIKDELRKLEFEVDGSMTLEHFLNHYLPGGKELNYRPLNKKLNLSQQLSSIKNGEIGNLYLQKT